MLLLLGLSFGNIKILYFIIIFLPPKLLWNILLFLFYANKTWERKVLES